MKIKTLSFANPFLTPNEDYFKVPHESLKRSGLVGFHERTISRTSDLNKDKARWRVVNVFLRTCPKSIKRVRLLSNPGPWWHFERLLEGRLLNREQEPRFVCCERDPDVYALSAAMLAAVFGGVAVKNEMGFPFVTCIKGHRKLYNADTFEYLQSHRRWKLFCGIWLDLTSTLTDKLGTKLALLRPVLRSDYCMIAITLIRGREQGEVRDTLRTGKTRKRHLASLIDEHCGPGFKLTDIFNYADSSPMQQVIFVRGALLGATTWESSLKPAKKEGVDGTP